MKTNTATIGTHGVTMKSPFDERENKRLRELLRKAVKEEKAPENLRAKISRMIREG